MVNENTRLDELELSVRTFNILRHAGLKTVGDLGHYTEKDLLRLPNFGRQCLNQIKEVVGEKALHPWRPPARTGPTQTIRIEALRAASRIAAGMYAGGMRPTLDGETEDVQGWIISIAKHFANYLNKGET